jgi:hypothetical protein
MYNVEIGRRFILSTNLPGHLQGYDSSRENSPESLNVSALVTYTNNAGYENIYAAYNFLSK